MSTNHNSLGQEIGSLLSTWNTCPKPAKKTMVGAYCRLEALDATCHCDGLWQAYTADTEDRIWTYLPYGPFTTQSQFALWLSDHSATEDPLFYAIIDTSSGKAVGIATYLRIQPEVGVIEVGHINYSPALQQTTAATEAMYLMMKNAFELGYRRYEWKCDNLNLGSQKAAKRLGFSYDGLFKQATIYKGRNRDTAWFSILDASWPSIDAEYQRWLAADNFTSDGIQLSKLST